MATMRSYNTEIIGALDREFIFCGFGDPPVRRDGLYTLLRLEEFKEYNKDETRDDLRTRECHLDLEIGFRLWE